MGAVELLPGNGRFNHGLWAMRARCMDFSPVFALIDEAMLAYEEKRFDDEGPGWADLAPATELRKQDMPYQDILQRGEPGHTADLKNSLTTHGYGSLFSITPLTLTMGTQVSYARYHQKGFKHLGGGKVPARPPWPDVKELAALWRVWRGVLQDYLMGGYAAAAVSGGGIRMTSV